MTTSTSDLVSTSDTTELLQTFEARAFELGFGVVAVTTACLPEEAGQNLADFVDARLYGDMSWMADTLERRQHPQAMWQQARSAIVLGLNYAPDFDPLDRLKDTQSGVISCYALNRDYHDIVKGKLKQLAGWFAQRSGAEVKVFVDTAPLMEKPLAAQAGIGWQGKHTNLVSRQYGSWLFIGTILTTAELPPSKPHDDNCGECRACLDVCPTKAFLNPYQIDARRCISYLTIEHKGHISPELRKQMGNRIYGCDDCLAVCPWNKFAQDSREAKLKARTDLMSAGLVELSSLNDTNFRKTFSGSPVKRIGRDRFVRNVLIALGNSQTPDAVKALKARLDEPSSLIRAMAVWGLRQHLGAYEFEEIRKTKRDREADPYVLKEWEQPE